MVLPLILLGIGVVTGTGGVGLGGAGAAEIVKAKKTIAKAGATYDAEYSLAEAAVKQTNANLAEFGSLQKRAITDVVVRMEDWLRRNEKQVRESERLLVDGVDATTQKVPGLGKLDVEAAAWVTAAVGSVATGAAVNSAVTSAVMTWGSASTGTAISTLSGAAATNATLAALGGGAIAEGGGGMALGSTVLGTVALGPALLFSGAVIKKQGAKAKTQATKGASDVSVAVAELHAKVAALGGVDRRTAELSELLHKMRLRAIVAMDDLESEPFVPELHAARFQRAMNLVVGVRDIAATLVIDADGALTDRGAGLKIKYRHMTEESDGE